MISEGRIFKILTAPHTSEKSSLVVENFNTIVLKVMKNSTKFEIKKVIEKLFSVEVNKVNILIVKGKRKRLTNGKNSYKSDWKKAYVLLKKGCKLDFIGISK